MTSSVKKQQRACRFTDSFLLQNFESLCPQQFFKWADEYGSFHKNFEFHVNNGSFNKQRQ